MSILLIITRFFELFQLSILNSFNFFRLQSYKTFSTPTYFYPGKNEDLLKYRNIRKSRQYRAPSVAQCHRQKYTIKHVPVQSHDPLQGITL